MTTSIPAKITPKTLKEITAAVQRELSRILGDQLEAIYLYGSQARGEAKPDSDIDLLIVLRSNFDYFDMIKKTSESTADLSLQYDTVISCVFVTHENYMHRHTPLLMNIHREGIAL